MRSRSHPPLVAGALAALLLVTGAAWQAVMAEPSAGGAPRGLAAVPGAPPAVELPEPCVAALLAVPLAQPLIQELVQAEDTPGTWTLSGRVTDDLGRPLAGATISVGARKARADDGGRFALADLPALDEAAKLSVVARADWHVSERLPVRGPVGRDGAAPLDFTLDRGATLAGQVLGTDGRAVAGARVVALHGAVSAEPRVPLAADEQCTGFDGRFLFECVEPGEWTVTAEAIGRVGQRMQVSLLPGEAAACVPLVVDSAASLDGRVLDLSGAPVVGAEVRFEWLGEDDVQAGPAAPPTNPGGPGPRRIVNVPYPRMSGADGSFHAEDLAPGLWRVAAIPPAGVLGPMPGVVRLQLGEGEAGFACVPLAEPRRLRGVVVDGAGLPVADIDVTAEELGLLDWRRIAPSVRTNPLGRFVVEVAPDADVRLTCAWQARELHAQQTVGPGDDEALLQLEPSARAATGESAAAGAAPSAVP